MKKLDDIIVKEIDSIKDEIIEARRYLHQHPEVGFETRETEKFIREKLESWGIEILPSEMGVLGRIPGKNHDKVMCLRADIDALGLVEENDVPYKSVYEGKMHGCGHDGHTATLLGAAKVINNHKDDLKLDVVLVFQPAEEGPAPGGATIMVEALKENGIVEKTVGIFGLHVANLIPTGIVATKKGALTASVDNFDITIIGSGGHAGMPQFAVDPISIGAQFVSAMESFMARKLDPFDSSVCSVGTFNAGISRNVIPEKVTMSGTIRCLREESRTLITDNMDRILKGLCESRGATYELRLERTLSVLYNNDEATDYAMDAVRNVIGDSNLLIFDSGMMGAEDFANYSHVMPASFLMLGSGNEAKGLTVAQHNPSFDFDEDAMVVGAKIFCTLVYGYEE